MLELPVEPLGKSMMVDTPGDGTFCIEEVCRGCELLIIDHIFVYDFIMFGM